MLERFEELKISEPILRALNDMGFEEPTPIQQEAIPVAMEGLDTLALRLGICGLLIHVS